MPSRAPMIALAAVAAALCVALVVGARRVAALESHERDLAGAITHLYDSGSVSTTGARTLVSAELHRGDVVTFELCSGDEMDPAIWAGPAQLEIVLRVPDGEERIIDAQLEPSVLEGARRSSTGACLVFGRGTLTTAGTYDVRLSWAAPPAFASVPLRARVLVRRSLETSDGNLVFAVFCLSILLALVGGLRKAPAPTETDPLPRAVGRVALGIGLTMLAMTGFSMFAPGGRTSGLLSGLALGLAEIAIAIALVRTPRGERLAWHRHAAPAARSPSPVPTERTADGLAKVRAVIEMLRATAFGFLIAPLVGFMLRFAAIESLATVPSTGEAPIEAFVALPSGMLSFALIAVVAPLAEEIFFRGLVFGSLLGSGSRLRVALAFAGAWLLFGLVHLPQTWGNWGGLLAIVVAGLGFTTLRAVFRSTLVPAVAHLVYNGLLAAAALTGAIAAGA